GARGGPSGARRPPTKSRGSAGRAAAPGSRGWPARSRRRGGSCSWSGPRGGSPPRRSRRRRPPGRAWSVSGRASCGPSRPGWSRSRWPSTSSAISAGDVMSQPGWEHFEVEADIGVHAWGPTLEACFRQCALGVFALIVPLEAVTPAETREVGAQAEGPEALLVAWINELLYLHDVEG